MPVTGKVTLANLLPVVLGSLVHPALRGVRVRVLVGAGARHTPEEVLALVGALLRGAVLHVADVLGEVVGPLLGFLGEVVVPLEGGEALLLAAVVLDVEALLLIGGETHCGCC